MSRTAKATALQIEASTLRSVGRTHDHIRANTMEMEAAALLRLDSAPIMAMGEALPAEFDDERITLYNTLEDNPDHIAVDASGERLELLGKAAALEMGLDLATTIGPVTVLRNCSLIKWQPCTRAG